MPSSSGRGLHPENVCADPRRQAAAALARVDGHGAHAARLLTRAVPTERELVLGVLRWQLTLDHMLARHLRQPIAELDVHVRAALRLGLYEAKRMRTPTPVAVAEAVRVTKALAPRAGGLVNAVLRRAVGEPWPDPADLALPLALRTSHPEWLVRRWVGLLGEPAAAAALAADQSPAPLTLLEAVSDRDALVRAGSELRPHPVVAGALEVTGGAREAIAALRAGHAYAIDAAAIAVARLLPCSAGLAVDLAAAPGGKSLVLAGERPGVRVLAVDFSLGRTLLMRANLKRLGRRLALVVADAAAAPLRPASCAALLLDAPCSGTGTLRRHPEIRWRLQAADLPRLAAGQRRLAEAAAALLRPGGVLLYSTCSLEPEENAGVVERLGLEALPVTPELPALVLPSGGAVIPPTAASDGFTVHLLRRPG
jgi:16S rRNA (cytosine967-C5)-methyltransferase